MKEARYTLDNTDLYILLIYNAFQSNIIENKFICCAYPHSLQNFIIENPSSIGRKSLVRISHLMKLPAPSGVTQQPSLCSSSQ